MRAVPTEIVERRCRSLLNACFLAAAFAHGSFTVFAGFVFVMPFANLLLDLLAHQVNRRVEVSFRVFGKQVRPRHSQPHRALELPFRWFARVVFEDDSRVQSKPIQVFQLINP
jgi:hypothetical protein